MATVVNKSSPPSWELTKKVYDDLRTVGSAVEAVDMEGAAFALPGATLPKISTSDAFIGYAPEYEKYADAFATGIGINYLAYVAIKATTVAMTVMRQRCSQMSQHSPSNFHN